MSTHRIRSLLRRLRRKLNGSAFITARAQELGVEMDRALREHFDLSPADRLPSFDEQIAASRACILKRYQGKGRPGLATHGYASGGLIHGAGTPDDDRIPALLSEGGPITASEQADVLGLTVEARRLREQGK